jgi:hypothetical protein
MADTLTTQHTAYLTKGFVCYSEMGQIFTMEPEHRTWRAAPLNSGGHAWRDPLQRTGCRP